MLNVLGIMVASSGTPLCCQSIRLTAPLIMIVCIGDYTSSHLVAIDTIYTNAFRGQVQCFVK